MDPDDLQGWFVRHQLSPPGIHDCRLARLIGHQLVFNYYSRARRGGAANVEPAVGQEVYGLVLWVDTATLVALDRKEGAPQRYARQPVATTFPDGSVTRSWLYSVTPAYRSQGFIPPSPEYLALLTRAAERHAFPDAYRHRLTGIATSSLRASEPAPTSAP